jgi:hypothetical protein
MSQPEGQTAWGVTLTLAAIQEAAREQRAGELAGIALRLHAALGEAHAEIRRLRASLRASLRALAPGIRPGHMAG